MIAEDLPDPEPGEATTNAPLLDLALATAWAEHDADEDEQAEPTEYCVEISVRIMTSVVVAAEDPAVAFEIAEHMNLPPPRSPGWAEIGDWRFDVFNEDGDLVYDA